VSSARVNGVFVHSIATSAIGAKNRIMKVPPGEIETRPLHARAPDLTEPFKLIRPSLARSHRERSIYDSQRPAFYRIWVRRPASMPRRRRSAELDLTQE
jgi:hypothetical protein